MGNERAETRHERDAGGSPVVLRFGIFELDPRSGELFRAGVRVKLQHQPARVLALLAGRPGQLLTREEIQEQVWGSESRVDAEHGLNFCIRQIRAALNDDAQAPRFVETVPRIGYRFVAPVEEIAREPADRRAAAVRERWRRLAVACGALAVLAVLVYLGWSQLREAPPEDRVLLAVLPFEDLSGDADQEYFSDGLTEEMITQLGRFRPDRLGVIARTSAMQYRGADKTVEQIGRELGVDYIMEGSVRRAGDRVRISVQLIQVSDQSHVWADSYEGDVGDMLALQARVAGDVVEEIGVKLTPGEGARLAESHTLNHDAYWACLQGRYFLRRLTAAGAIRAVGLFEEAIAHDPEYAAAYAGLAMAYYVLSNMRLDPDTAMRRARSAALRALELDDGSAEAHVALALVRAFYDWDWRGAEREFQRAIALQPSSTEAHGWYGTLLSLLGRYDEGVQQIKQALALDPLSLDVNARLALPFYLEGRYQLALEQTRRTLELDSTFYLSHTGLGAIYEELGNPGAAVREYERARRIYDSPEIVAFLARAHAKAGERARALELLAELEAIAADRYVSPYDLALVHEALGDAERALQLLERAYETRAEGMASLMVDPRFAALRSDPRFQALVRRMGFPS